MDDNFEQIVKDAIAYSKEEALRLYSEYLGTSHLFLGIIKATDNLYIENLIEIEEKELILELERIGSEGKRIRSRDRKIELTRQAERALKTSFLEAKLFNDKNINVFHLILCILRNENDSTTKLLNSYGVNYDSFKYIYKKTKLWNELATPNEDYKINFYEEELFIEFELSSFNGLSTKKILSKSDRIRLLSELLSSKDDIINLELNSINKTEIELISKINTLKKLKIINSTNIESLSFVSSFPKLSDLSINNCKIKNLKFLTDLKSLINLDISNNEIEDITPLKDLKKLEYLTISNNKVKSLNPIINNIYNGLIIVFDNNKIENFSEVVLIKLLKSKIELDLETVKLIKTLVVLDQKYEVAARLRSYEVGLEQGLNLDDILINKDKELEWLRKTYLEYSLKKNSIQSPPLEIILGGIQDVKNYFKQIKKDTSQRFLFEGKLLIIGDGGTGKTSLARKIENVKAKLPNNNETTFNIDINQIEFDINDKNSSKMYINTWDFGGQKIYRGTHQLFFSDKCLYILVDDNRDEKTDFSYWLNTVEQIAGKESKLIIVINKKHNRNNISFDENGYKKQFSKLNFDFFPIDLLHEEDTMEILKDLIKVRFRELPLIGNPLPTSWVDIREELSTLTENFISFEKFINICKSHSIKDLSVINTLCSYFDNIGVFTHYNDDAILKERIYLDSNWLVSTIYEVLDNSLISEKNGIISSEIVNEIWKNNGLDFEFERLCALMSKFGLMYYTKETNQFVIPEKLPKITPYEKWEYENTNSLSFKYEFEKYNPKGLMSKLIVGLNKYIKNHSLVWHRGMNIEYENTFAEIIETYNIKNTFEIRIFGQNKTGLLAIIIDKFEEILQPFSNLNYEKYIQCYCSKCSKIKEPHLFKYSDLIKRKNKGVRKIECEIDYDKVDVDTLLNGIEKNYNKMNKIDIFLASSSELQRERDEIEIFINRENKKLVEKNTFLSLHRWEDFVDSISSTRLQDEYNKAAMNSHIFISLFSTKVGIFTEEEFEKVHLNFKEKQTPKHIYTFFKNEKKGMNEINEEDFESLVKFKRRLVELGHYKTNYEDSNDLIKKIKLQLDKILPEMIN